MNVIILAGGFGTRISKEGHHIPKPMIEIGNKPIIWHIMKHYSSFGYNDFIICCGYKHYILNKFFSDYVLRVSDVTLDFTSRSGMLIHNKRIEPWKVTLVDTGLNTMTGGRIKRIRDYIGNDSFMLTYGDGVSDVNISKIVEFHRRHKKMCTITAVQPEGRFGVMSINKDDDIYSFQEKPKESGDWINGGFMVVEPELIDYIKDDKTTLEKEPLEEIASQGQLKAYKHHGFWKCMDTLRDKEDLQKIWDSGDIPWKTWRD